VKRGSGEAPFCLLSEFATGTGELLRENRETDGCRFQGSGTGPG
jgi:hypothetical protein